MVLSRPLEGRLTNLWEGTVTSSPRSTRAPGIVSIAAPAGTRVIGDWQCSASAVYRRGLATAAWATRLKTLEVINSPPRLFGRLVLSPGFALLCGARVG